MSKRVVRNPGKSNVTGITNISCLEVLGRKPLNLLIFLSLTFPLFVTQAAESQEDSFIPVSNEMLIKPDPNDWLMFSRSYDAQRFTPLDQIDVNNVNDLGLVWSRGMPEGISETIPLVYNGVMYVIVPGGRIQALDATNGDLIWEYARAVDDTTARSKGLAIYEDLIFYTSHDSYVIAIDARTGLLQWEAKTDTRAHTSSPIVVAGKVISGGACMGNRNNCYIVAHAALTGEELWRFYTTPAPGEPGDESWGGADLIFRIASTWGLPGSYDPETNLIYWGVANAMPDLRLERHGGDPDATPRIAPSDLYSNSTIALRPDTGELVWYYQHLPGDDADLDHTHERTLVNVKVNPNPDFVKWINPNITLGEERDVTVTVPEGGGIFVNDRVTGEFLWATPFPSETPQMMLSDIELETGRTIINWDLVAKERGVSRTVCFWNTRSYWPTAYHPGTNSLYTSYIEACRQMNADDSWVVVPRPGSDPDTLTGIARIDLSTGEVSKFDIGRAPSNGAMLTTAGNLVFHGDMNRRFRAFDAQTGERLWETVLGGNISVSTISYAVDGVQYVAVMTGDTLKVPELLELVPELELPEGHNEIYVFALPQ